MVAFWPDEAGTGTWVMRFLTAAFLVASMAAHADEDQMQPEGMQVMLGQYTGYLDWVTKQRFTLPGIPDDVVNNYGQCWSRSLYEMMTPVERGMLDNAARTNGMTGAELDIFTRGVGNRVGPREAWDRIIKSCEKQFVRYRQWILVGREGE